MKVRLEHGAELDLLTADEVRELAAEFNLGRELGGPQRQWPNNAVTLDASGNGFCRIYTVPVDRTFTLHRVAITADGYTPGVPFTNAAGWIEVHHNDAIVDFFSLAAGLPAIGTWGTENGPHFAEREKVIVRIFGGPANGNVNVRGQGTLEPLLSD